jgi:hypothetical protein
LEPTSRTWSANPITSSFNHVVHINGRLASASSLTLLNTLVPRSKANLKNCPFRTSEKAVNWPPNAPLRLRGMGHQADFSYSLFLGTFAEALGSFVVRTKRPVLTASSGRRKFRGDRTRDSAARDPLWLIQTISRLSGSSAPPSRAAEKHDGRNKCHNKPQSPHELVSQGLVCACKGVDHGF